MTSNTVTKKNSKSKKLAAIPTMSGSLDSYISAVNQISILTREEERELGQLVFDNNDFEAAHRLVTSHLRFVVYVARSYAGYGLPIGDLIQEGNIGLMKAVKRYDPAHKVRLVSFAVHWIRAEIHEYILKNWRILKVATTKAHRKLFFNLRKNKKRLGWLRGPEIAKIAEDLNVKPEVVVEMESRLHGQDVCFDLPLDDSDEDSSYSPQAWLTNAAPGPEKVLEQETESKRNHDLLFKGLDKLDERSLDIIESRWLTDKKTTLQQLAKKYSVSAERIRQLEVVAMKKLKGQMFVA
ncbi:RNA polymerase sigma factor RpoH [hydrothermal vent metagenome]|uniref:RNA polymerase sigma factor RpoH n=1 Tax=hydrothermal vent metagenome TaxID=652676 RepID=A0A3B0VTI5_9ZZZZ